MFDVYHDTFKINLWTSFYTVEEAFEYMLDVNRNSTEPGWERMSRDKKLDYLEDNGWAVLSDAPATPKPKKKPTVKALPKDTPPPRPAPAKQSKPAPQKWSDEALNKLVELHEKGESNPTIAKFLQNEGLRGSYNPGAVSDKLHDLRKLGWQVTV